MTSDASSVRREKVGAGSPAPTAAETIKAWDDAAWSDGWKLHVHPRYDSSDDYERLRRLVGEDRGQRILDFGCGGGRLMVPLAAEYRDVTGCDSSLGMLARLPGDVPWFVWDGFTPIPDRFDVVIAVNVLIHHSHHDAERIMEGVAGCLNPGGRFIFTLGVYDESREPESWCDVAIWTRDELAAAADWAGLEVERVTVIPGRFNPQYQPPEYEDFQVLVKP